MERKRPSLYRRWIFDLSKSKPKVTRWWETKKDESSTVTLGWPQNNYHEYYLLGTYDWPGKNILEDLQPKRHLYFREEGELSGGLWLDLSQRLLQA